MCVRDQNGNPVDPTAQKTPGLSPHDTMEKAVKSGTGTASV